MDDLEQRGWIKVGAQNYRHHCGGKVTKRGKFWTSRTVAGVLTSGHATAIGAATYLQESDPSFWTYGRVASIGGYGGVWFTEGCLDEQKNEGRVFACYQFARDDFAEFEPTFKKYFFGKATCARCLRPMAELKVQTLREFNGKNSRRRAYFVCGCGHPIWRSGLKLLDIGAMATDERSRLRKQSLKTEGGKHRRKEILDILTIQKGRCIYCNVRFTKKVPPTKDHLLAVVDGGANWALNIMMACRGCNSRRCDIPFRTYCKLLSPTQNRRILLCLRERILALDFDNLSREEFGSFEIELALHDPRHWRYRDIQCRSAIARRNATHNYLLPRTASLIQKTIIEELKMKLRKRK
ncbi:MAG: HNH endonuclease [Terriglobales bacterium]